MSADVTTIVSTATIGGVVRDVKQVSIDREIATDLPEQVTGGGGMEKATGTVEVDEPDQVVIVERRSPWAPADGWPPQRSAPVTIDTVVDDAPPSRRFTGRVASTSGTSGDPVTVDLEDATDDLRVKVTHEPLLWHMPRWSDAREPRNIGLRADYIANAVFRKAGFYNTPPATFGTPRLSVPAQGSLWPEEGVCVDAATAPNVETWRPAPWGWSASAFDATYRHPSTGTAGAGTLRGRILVIGLCVDPTSDGASRVTVTLGPATVSLRVTNDRRVQILHNGSLLRTFNPAPGWTRVELVRSATNVTIRTDNGSQTTLDHPLTGPALDGPYDSTEVNAATRARIAGLMVAFANPNTYTGQYVTQSRTATIRAGSLLGRMDAMPTLVSRDGLDLLREISEATCTSLWIDQAGHLHWVHPDVLNGQPPAMTLTADADLLDLAWQDTADAARRSVTLEHRAPQVTTRRKARVTVWEGPGETLGQGESLELIASSPGGEDWVMVDQAPRQMLILANGTNYDGLPDEALAHRDFNQSVGSWVGGSPLNQDGDSASKKQQTLNDNPGGADRSFEEHGYPAMTWDMEQIGPQAWKITQALNNISDNYWIENQHSLDLPDSLRRPVNQTWNGQRMPLVRAKGRIEWLDEEHTSSTTGPAGYGHLTLDVGPWAGTGVAALADWIAAQVTRPAPILRDLPIVWRPDVELGQVIDVVEDAVHHVRLRVLVVGLAERHGQASSEMTLTGRVLTAEATRFTYDDLDALGLTYDQIANSGATYYQLSQGDV